MASFLCSFQQRYPKLSRIKKYWEAKAETYVASGNWCTQHETTRCANCLLNKTYPILEALQTLPLTSMVWQEMPPTDDYHERNNYISDAVNYFIKQLLAPLNITVIPSSAISKVWSENLGSMKTHLFDVTNMTLVVLPPGNVVTYMLAYSLCEDFR